MNAPLQDPATLLINTVTYTPLQIACFALGGLFWVIAYVAVIRSIRRHGVVEIPAAAVACNMAWETTWGLLYRTDLGTLFVWGYRSWFVLDLFIFGFLFLHGARHLRTEALRSWFRPGLAASYVSWLVLFFLFVRQGFDTATGLTTGFIATLLMSALYVLVELSAIAPEQYSRLVAWSKLLGNGFAAAFCVLVYPDRHFLLVLCAVTFVLDVAYLLLFPARRRVASPVPAPA
jgi:hypothetical protein